MSFIEGPVEGHIKAPNAPVAELHVCPSGCAYSSVQDAVDLDETERSLVQAAMQQLRVGSHVYRHPTTRSRGTLQ
jgi:hypothetical protein